MIFLFRTCSWCGLNLLIAATLGVVLLFSGCASRPQSITDETPTSTLRRELQHLESSKPDGQSKTGRRKSMTPKAAGTRISCYCSHPIRFGHRFTLLVSKMPAGSIAGVSGNLPIDLA
jgi:hypothetical protein